MLCVIIFGNLMIKINKIKFIKNKKNGIELNCDFFYGDNLYGCKSNLLNEKIIDEKIIKKKINIEIPFKLSVKDPALTPVQVELNEVDLQDTLVKDFFKEKETISWNSIIFATSFVSGIGYWFYTENNKNNVVDNKNNVESVSSPLTIKGNVNLGRVIEGHGLAIEATNLQAESLIKSALADDGSFNVVILVEDLPARLEVIDMTTDADYLDPVTGNIKDLSVNLSSLITSAPSSELLTININPLTTIFDRVIVDAFPNQLPDSVQLSSFSFQFSQLFLNQEGPIESYFNGNQLSSDDLNIDNTENHWQSLLYAIANHEALNLQQVIDLFIENISLFKGQFFVNNTMLAIIGKALGDSDNDADFSNFVNQLIQRLSQHSPDEFTLLPGQTILFSALYDDIIEDTSLSSDQQLIFSAIPTAGTTSLNQRLIQQDDVISVGDFLNVTYTPSSPLLERAQFVLTSSTGDLVLPFSLVFQDNIIDLPPQQSVIILESTISDVKGYEQSGQIKWQEDNFSPFIKPMSITDENGTFSIDAFGFWQYKIDRSDSEPFAVASNKQSIASIIFTTIDNVEHQLDIIIERDLKEEFIDGYTSPSTIMAIFNAAEEVVALTKSNQQGYFKFYLEEPPVDDAYIDQLQANQLYHYAKNPNILVSQPSRMIGFYDDQAQFIEARITDQYGLVVIPDELTALPLSHFKHFDNTSVEWRQSQTDNTVVGFALPHQWISIEAASGQLLASMQTNHDGYFSIQGLQEKLPANAINVINTGEIKLFQQNNHLIAMAAPGTTVVFEDELGNFLGVAQANVNAIAQFDVTNELNIGKATVKRLDNTVNIHIENNDIILVSKPHHFLRVASDQETIGIIKTNAVGFARLKSITPPESITAELITSPMHIEPINGYPFLVNDSMGEVILLDAEGNALGTQKIQASGLTKLAFEQAVEARLLTGEASYNLSTETGLQAIVAPFSLEVIADSSGYWQGVIQADHKGNIKIDSPLSLSLVNVSDGSWAKDNQQIVSKAPPLSWVVLSNADQFIGLSRANDNGLVSFTLSSTSFSDDISIRLLDEASPLINTTPSSLAEIGLPDNYFVVKEGDQIIGWAQSDSTGAMSYEWLLNEPLEIENVAVELIDSSTLLHHIGPSSVQVIALPEQKFSIEMLGKTLIYEIPQDIPLLSLDNIDVVDSIKLFDAKTPIMVEHATTNEWHFLAQPQSRYWLKDDNGVVQFIVTTDKKGNALVDASIKEAITEVVLVGSDSAVAAKMDSDWQIQAAPNEVLLVKDPITMESRLLQTDVDGLAYLNKAIISTDYQPLIYQVADLVKPEILIDKDVLTGIGPKNAELIVDYNQHYSSVKTDDMGFLFSVPIQHSINTLLPTNQSQLPITKVDDQWVAYAQPGTLVRFNKGLDNFLGLAFSNNQGEARLSYEANVGPVNAHKVILEFPQVDILSDGKTLVGSAMPNQVFMLADQFGEPLIQLQADNNGYVNTQLSQPFNGAINVITDFDQPLMITSNGATTVYARPFEKIALFHQGELHAIFQADALGQAHLDTILEKDLFAVKLNNGRPELVDKNTHFEVHHSDSGQIILDNQSKEILAFDGTNSFRRDDPISSTVQLIPIDQNPVAFDFIDDAIEVVTKPSQNVVVYDHYYQLIGLGRADKQGKIRFDNTVPLVSDNMVVFALDDQMSMPFFTVGLAFFDAAGLWLGNEFITDEQLHITPPSSAQVTKLLSSNQSYMVEMADTNELILIGLPNTQYKVSIEDQHYFYETNAAGFHQTEIVTAIPENSLIEIAQGVNIVEVAENKHLFIQATPMSKAVLLDANGLFIDYLEIDQSGQWQSILPAQVETVQLVEAGETYLFRTEEGGVILSQPNSVVGLVQATRQPKSSITSYHTDHHGVVEIALLAANKYQPVRLTPGEIWFQVDESGATIAGITDPNTVITFNNAKALTIGSVITNEMGNFTFSIPEYARNEALIIQRLNQAELIYNPINNQATELVTQQSSPILVFDTTTFNTILVEERLVDPIQENYIRFDLATLTPQIMALDPAIVIAKPGSIIALERSAKVIATGVADDQGSVTFNHIGELESDDKVISVTEPIIYQMPSGQVSIASQPGEIIAIFEDNVFKSSVAIGTEGKIDTSLTRIDQIKVRTVPAEYLVKSQNDTHFFGATAANTTLLMQDAYGNWLQPVSSDENGFFSLPLSALPTEQVQFNIILGDEVLFNLDQTAQQLTVISTPHALIGFYDDNQVLLDQHQVDNKGLLVMDWSESSLSSAMLLSLAPKGLDQALNINEDSSINLNEAIFGLDSSGEDEPLSVLLTELSGQGSLSYQDKPMTFPMTIPARQLSELQFIPAPNTSGEDYVQIQFYLVNALGVVSPEAYTLNINVIDDFEDPPTSMDTEITLLEDVPYQFSEENFIFIDADNGDKLAAIQIHSTPNMGILSTGTELAQGAVINTEHLSQLEYQPNTNVFGLAVDQFTFQVMDLFGKKSTELYTVNVNITAVKDPPSSDHNVKLIQEDETGTYSGADFVFNDPDSDDNLAAIIIESLPDKGQLKLANEVVTTLQRIPAEQLNQLVFTPKADADQQHYSEWAFRVVDSNNQQSEQSYTAAISLIAVNDAPSGENSLITTLEDTVYQFEHHDFNFVDPDQGDFLQAILIIKLPEQGVLYLSDDEVNLGQFITADELNLLRFVPSLNEAELNYATIQYQVIDQADEASDVIKMRIDVIAVEEDPISEDRHSDLDEDGQYYFSVDDFSFYDADPFAYMSELIVEQLPQKGDLWLDNVRITEGQRIPVNEVPFISYQPEENVFGFNIDSFTFKVVDNTDRASFSYPYYFSILAHADRPESFNQSLVLSPARTYQFKQSDFLFYDADPDDYFAAMIITSLPSDGQLLFNGDEVDIEQVFSLEQISQLVFEADNTDDVTDFQIGFKVEDNTGLQSDIYQINLQSISSEDELSSLTNDELLEENTEYFKSIGYSEQDPLVQLAAAPFLGQLTLNGAVMVENATFNLADIADLRFQPVKANFNQQYGKINFALQNTVNQEQLPVIETLISVENDTNPMESNFVLADAEDAIILAGLDQLPKPMMNSNQFIDNNDLGLMRLHEYLSDDSLIADGIENLLLFKPTESVDFMDNDVIHAQAEPRIVKLSNDVLRSEEALGTLYPDSVLQGDLFENFAVLIQLI